MNRPVTTLFMLMSLDGKISTGSTDNMDFDRDLKEINGLKQGLHQYYEIEQTTDLWSFNTGRVQAKMGVNHLSMPEKTPVSFVLYDNSHLNENGVRYFCARSKQFVLFTNNRDHPAFNVKEDNLHVFFQYKLDLEDMLKQLKYRFDCERLTIQSGGTFNSLFLQNKLIDYVDIVVAPVLVGGKDTVSLIEGESISTKYDLSKLGILKVMDIRKLEDDYIRLRYKVIS